MTDLAVQLLIIEGIPSLVLVYYLYHKKRMYMLEKGILEKNDPKVRSERRIINGLFLTLAGVFMIVAPNIAAVMGIEAELNFELLLASLIVLCAGLSMLIAGEVLKLKSRRQYEPDDLAK
ncbi:MAG: hypothetical protein ACE14P_01375 [Methanotrichaceae archaeon]